MEFKKALVVGAGAMGAGIAQLFAQSGIPVTLTDRSEEIASDAVAGLENRMARRVEQGKMSDADKNGIIGRITAGTGHAAASGADIVVEAIFEDMEVKKQTLTALDEAAPDRTIFASNTTSLSISEMAAATSRPDKVVGMHFFNPPVVMKLVEIMPGIGTAPETVDAVSELARTLGKQPVQARFDSPAGIGSRVLAGSLNEAVEVFAQGLASAEDIDAAMKMGCGFPMGPLELIDLIGVDIHLAKTETLYRELGDQRYRPNFLLKKMARAGHLGRKSGRGFYSYED
ncbi:MAG: 3-hydroxyacyl-CoA dehydrogenase NAD-binding domain-containing protein [Nitrospinota bacterium]|jgi:3-hydroxybutyryl-CoA dehydrogenase|nr:3-hydroxyacyl-CoA dehydrogenase NAD-binding domain-containing protein [Nitrospinota bacterium]MDP7166470.1 3-hydroxyacyl-CoA dehydrogenase NAD-binding domain-containing protein [Nitrospinota bacterium]MDP7370480.1 3-hydroxyacyl-CoA dehydrogenase NAD-binding domain-containing protein [Nitrospinota bacterium]MDP7502478.1 3-hydroxyacyl-CoA dehydrogenase NAD-binding domain-containing protein [Nitrospinota bacterium]MDP7663514.1 3-hydroxyacyl-CoA dehydrogenase NAD-binding domain-containing protei